MKHGKYSVHRSLGLLQASSIQDTLTEVGNIEKRVRNLSKEKSRQETRQQQQWSAVCAGGDVLWPGPGCPGVRPAAPSQAGTRTRPEQEAGRPGGLAALAPVASLAPCGSSCRLATPSFPASRPGSWHAFRPPPLVTPAPVLSGLPRTLVESHKSFRGRTVCLVFSP